MKNIFKKYFIFFISLIIGILITSPSLIPSFNVDGFCTLSSGISNSIIVFMKAGRLITAFVYFIIDKVGLSFNVFSILSILLSNIFLSISVSVLYYLVKPNIKKEHNVLLYLTCFLIFYNPLNIELFLFEESCVICLGILLLTLSCKIFLNKSLLSKVISFVLCLMGVICYQGIACFYLVLSFTFIIIIFNNNCKFNIKEIIKKYIIVLLYYGVSLIISYIIVKFINSYVFTDGTEKIGTLNILYNITSAFNFLVYALKGLFCYTKRIYYYGAIFIELVIIFLSFFKGKNKNYLLLILLVLNSILCVVVPFIPNLGMNSQSNYTAARMCGTIGAVFGIIGLYYLLFLSNEIKYNTFFKILLIIYFIINSYLYLRISYNGLSRYKKDLDSVNIIYNKIFEYEENSGNIIDTIYYTTDSSVNYFYINSFNNSYNIRLYAVDWAMKCAVNLNKKKYNYIEMTIEEKKSRFGDKEYDVFSDEQLQFEDNKLYLLIY